jgi:hypothetical protein
MSGRRRFAALLVAVLGTLVSLVLGASAAQAVPGYTDHASISFSATGSCGHLTVSGEGFAPNEQVTLTLHTKVYTLTTVTTDANGDFSAAVTLPDGVDGNHKIVAVGTSGDRANGRLTLTNCGGTGGQSGGGGGGLSNTGVAVMSIGGLGLLLLIGGTILVVSGRRRRTFA